MSLYIYNFIRQSFLFYPRTNDCIFYSVMCGRVQDRVCVDTDIGGCLLPKNKRYVTKFI